ncbi:Rossmann-like and DUF2520 domain-containing protein [Zhouia sp. PK063]|uniref:Rossmann-like and DUF2520 domain-containing protein n=1 Tax=Zhouia sp. PK063 TaxID=3373602 RepID=UPI00378DEBB5
MIRIVIIGTGNVATHLLEAFSNCNTIEVFQVSGRIQPESSFFQGIETIATKTKADVYIIAVKDDKIAEVAHHFPLKNTLLVHTSGAAPMQVLNDKNRSGVFYPLQTFTKGNTVNFKNIPICIEATTEKDMQLLKKIATLISNKVYQISSEQRKTLHVAAVFVNNFTNQLYEIGNEICENHHIPFAILKPLIQETANKLNTLSPKEAQTGPAVRNDEKTIASHLEQLSNNSYKEIYKLLTASIKETHGRKKL